MNKQEKGTESNKTIPKQRIPSPDWEFKKYNHGALNQVRKEKEEEEIEHNT